MKQWRLAADLTQRQMAVRLKIQRGARRLLGKWRTITERGPDPTLPEIHSELREMRMNVCRAAAFVLVGWYLMISPAGRPDAPLSLWRTFHRYDDIRECESERSDGVDAGTWNRQKPILENETRRAKLPSAVCVSTDDPRLKAK